MAIGKDPKWHFYRWSERQLFIHFLELFQYYASDEIMLGKLLSLLPWRAEFNTLKPLQLLPITLNIKSRFIDSAYKIWPLASIVVKRMLVQIASLW